MNLRFLPKNEIEKLDDMTILKSIVHTFNEDNPASCSYVHDMLDKLGISPEKHGSCIDILEDSGYFKTIMDGSSYIGWIVNKEKTTPLERAKINIEDKFKITIDYCITKPIIEPIKDKPWRLIPISVGAVIAIGTVLIFSNEYKERAELLEMVNNFPHTTITYQDETYNIREVFAVYNNEQVWFCTAKLAEITEDEKLYGYFGRFGSGTVGEYYYREEIYEYYDIKTGEKICREHDEGFYIESIYPMYNMYSAREQNYTTTLENVENSFDIDYLLSREPRARLK
ncbi:MAG: hypothetical protein J6B98_05090 [Bacilli bacterium]|nr:hypothetical protein [Bacilli bacterium]